MVQFLFILALLAVILSIVWWSIKNGISPMPTSAKVKAELIKSLPECRGTIIDLGSGWGTLLIPLSHANREAQIIGYETSPIPFAFSYLRTLLCPNLHIYRRDFFSVSLENATMVICYLYPGAMQKLQRKFDQELKPGSWVISHTFALPDWKPVKIVQVDDLYRTKIYLYRK